MEAADELKIIRLFPSGIQALFERVSIVKPTKFDGRAEAQRVGFQFGLAPPPLRPSHISELAVIDQPVSETHTRQCHGDCEASPTSLRKDRLVWSEGYCCERQHQAYEKRT